MLKIVVISFVIGISCLLVHGQGIESDRFYVGTFTAEGAAGIYRCSFHPESGAIKLEQSTEGIENPSFLVVSPSRKYLYAVSRTNKGLDNTGGYAVAYRILDDGGLQLINRQVSNGEDPCHIDVSPDERFVAIASYASGTISLYPVRGDGGLAQATSVVKFEGRGPHRRQDHPHAHSIKFYAQDGLIYSADLGTDRINIFKREGYYLKKSEQEMVKLAPGAGPRHFDFHPSKEIIYVVNELNSTVTVLIKKNGLWKIIQNLSTIPAGVETNNYCADIHVSADGKYVYASNRGHNSIAVFDVSGKDGTLALKTTVKVEGDWPRNFTLHPGGRFLLVANQKSNNITVFRLDEQSGIPSYTGESLSLPSPVCLDFY